MNLYGKTVLVTGGAGFIGSEVVRQLCNMKYVKVKVLDDLSFGLLSNISRNAEFIKGDIRNKEIVKNCLKSVDIVFHFAALPFIPHSYLDPENIFTVNANGTLILVREAIKSKVKSFVFISSSEVYGTAQYVPMDENHPTLPHSTYATSKLAAERLAYTISKEHDLPLIILRPFNTYGLRDSHPRIIPEIISQLTKRDKLYVGNVKSARDMTHVSDIARGIIMSVKQNTVGEVINLGSGTEISVKELIEKIAQILGKDNYEIKVVKPRLRPFDVQRLYASIKKAKKLLNWEPKISLEEGLNKTIKWFISAKKWRWELEDYQKKKMGIPSGYINPSAGG